MNSHPVANAFGPAIFLSLVFLSLAFSFGPAQAQPPASRIAAPGIERFDPDPARSTDTGRSVDLKSLGQYSR